MNPEKTSAVASPKELLSYLKKSESAIQMALPKHLNADRMMRLALTSFSTNPALRQCSQQSILSSIVIASQLGLEPGIAGQGYLIPYKGTCTFVPGWQGLVGLLNNTGRATAWTGAVFQGDLWEFELGSKPSCRHIPGENFGDVDKMTWVYAVGQVNGSDRPVVEAWPVSRVWKHRDKFNKVGPRHYSFENQEMYARKVVLLQVLKYMPRSIELNNAIAAADADMRGMVVSSDNGVIVESEPADLQIESQPLSVPPNPELKPSEAKSNPAFKMTSDVPAGDGIKIAQSKSDSVPVGPHQVMEAFLESNGFTFDHFIKWAEGTGNVDNPTSVSDIREIHPDVLTRLLKAKGGLLKGLAQVKESMK